MASIPATIIGGIRRLRMIVAAVCRQSWILNPGITGIPTIFNHHRKAIVALHAVRKIRNKKSPKSCFWALLIYLSILSIYSSGDNRRLNLTDRLSDLDLSRAAFSAIEYRVAPVHPELVI